MQGSLCGMFRRVPLPVSNCQQIGMKGERMMVRIENDLLDILFVADPLRRLRLLPNVLHLNSPAIKSGLSEGKVGAYPLVFGCPVSDGDVISNKKLTTQCTRGAENSAGTTKEGKTQAYVDVGLHRYERKSTRSPTPTVTH
jgi:hypothetical protein